MIFGLTNNGYCINAGPNTINGYISDVDAVLNLIEEKYSTTSAIVSDRLSNAETTLSNARTALAQMVDDYNLAQETLQHDELLLEELSRDLEAAEKGKEEAWENVKTTGAAYRAAKSEQTTARSTTIGNCGSPEAERAARAARSERINAADNAVRVTGNAYQRANKEYDSLCAEVNRLSFKIERVRSAIEQLKRIIYQLDDSIKEARSFCDWLYYQIESVETAIRDFSKTAKKVIEKLKRCRRYAYDALEYMSRAASDLDKAGENIGDYSNNGYRVTMDGTDCLRRIIGKLESACAGTERSFERIRSISRQYGADMQDEISEATVYKMLEICDSIRSQNESLRETCNYLRTAKKALDNYLDLERASL